MYLIRNIFITIVCCLSVVALEAQNWQKATMTIGMEQSALNGATNNQTILQSLALAAKKNTSSIVLTNEWAFSTDLISLNEAQSEIRISIGKQFFSGDTDFRGFDLGEKLMADNFKGIVKLYSLFNTTEERIFTINIDSSRNSFAVGTVNLRSFPLKNIEVEFNFFGFSAAARDAFNRQISFVNAYWASCNYLDQLIAESAKDEDNILASPENTFVFWDKIRKGIKLGEKIRFTIQQEQISEESMALDQKLEAAVRMATRYETLLISSLGKRHNDPNLTASISRYYIQSLKSDQEKVNQYDFRDSDFLMQAARMQFDKVLDVVFREISPKSDPELAAALTLGGLVHLADEHYQKSDLANALIYYEDARTMNRFYDFVEDSALFTERIDAAKIGLLQSHLRVAAKAVETGNGKLANDYMEKSNAFMKEKIDEHLVDQLPGQSDELVETYIRLGNQYLDKKMYQQSIREFENAAETSKNFFNIRHSEQINQGLFAAHRAIFTGLLQEAEDLWLNNRKEEAKTRLQQAIDYRQQNIDFLRNSSEAFHLKTKMDQQSEGEGMLAASGLPNRMISNSGSNVYSSEMLNSAKSSILEQLKNAQLKAWANSMEEAWELYGAALENRKSYGLEFDADISSAMAELDSRMIDRICLNNQFRLEELMEQVNRNIRMKKLEALQSMLEEIIEIGTNNQGCQLKYEEAIKLNAYYLPYFRYQSDYKSIIETIFTRGLSEALPMYVAFDQNIAAYELEKYGISHIPLVQFIQRQNNPAMTWLAIDYFVDQMQADKTTALLLIAREQSFNREQSDEIQRKAGTFLAVAHWNSGAFNVDDQIVRITGNDRRLAVLQKSYLQASKEIKKQNR